MRRLLLWVAALIMMGSCSVAYALPIGASELEGGETGEAVRDLHPYPVYLVEAPAEEAALEVSPLAIDGSAYLGTISTAIYQYFRDISASLPVGSDYVFYRADQYNYRLVYGDGLTVSNGQFSGSNVNVINYYSYSYNDSNVITRYTDSSFSLDDPGAFIYTSLGAGYPRLFEGVSHREFTALFVLVAVACLYSFVVRLFK
jgi:hypothetical protein